MNNKSLSSYPAMYVIGFVLLFIRSYISMTPDVHVPIVIDNIGLLCGYFCLTLYLFLSKCNYKIWLLIFLGCFIYFRSKETGPLTFLFLICATVYLPNVKMAIRLWYYCITVLLLSYIAVYVIMYFFAFNELTFSIRNGIIRNQLFLSSPNLAGAVIVFWTLSRFVIKYPNKNNILRYLTSSFFLILGYYFTNSNTSLFIGILGLLLLFFSENFNFKKNKLNKFIELSPIYLTILSVLLATILYSDLSNALLTGRPSLWRHALQYFGITILGNDFYPVKTINDIGYVDYFNTIDSFYISSLTVFGIVFLIIYIYMFIKTCTNTNSLFIDILLFISSIYGFTEVHIINPFICFPIFFLALSFKKNNKYNFTLLGE